VIVDTEMSFPGIGKIRQAQMYISADEVVWLVTCPASPEKFGDFEADFPGTFITSSTPIYPLTLIALICILHRYKYNI
jgi:hypothetical protein